MSHCVESGIEVSQILGATRNNCVIFSRNLQQLEKSQSQPATITSGSKFSAQSLTNSAWCQEKESLATGNK